MLRQGIRDISATQKYPIGYRFAEGGVGDRVFRYCLAVTALLEKRGAGNGDPLHEQNTAVIAYAGDQDLTIVLAAAAVDQYKDGYISIWTAVPQVCLKVKGNALGDGTNTVIHLEEPLLYDVAAATFTGLHENIYRSATSKAGGTPFASVVAVPILPVTINNFFWGQTWGPIVGIAHAGAGIGAAANERCVYFANDGSIGLQSDCVGTVDCQIAGFMLADTTLGDDIFFMLQLAP